MNQNIHGENGGKDGVHFLVALLPVLRSNGGECHWYDFCADHEYPICTRTRSFLITTCEKYGYEINIIHIANVGSIAKRQVRSKFPSM